MLNRITNDYIQIDLKIGNDFLSLLVVSPRSFQAVGILLGLCVLPISSNVNPTPKSSWKHFIREIAPIVYRWLHSSSGRYKWHSRRRR